MRLLTTMAASVMIFASAMPKAQTPPVEYIGITPDTDIKSAAIVAIDQKPSDRPSFRCHIRTMSKIDVELNLAVNGESKVVAMAPGIYRINTRYDDNGHEGYLLPEIAFEAGKMYRLSCTRKRYKNIQIEVKEITSPAASP